MTNQVMENFNFIFNNAVHHVIKLNEHVLSVDHLVTSVCVSFLFDVIESALGPNICAVFN